MPSNLHISSAPLSGHTVVRMKEASQMLGLSAKHIRHLERTGQFPPRVRLGPKAIGFRLLDLKAWIDSRLCEYGKGSDSYEAAQDGGTR